MALMGRSELLTAARFLGSLNGATGRQSTESGSLLDNVQSCTKAEY